MRMAAVQTHYPSLVTGFSSRLQDGERGKCNPMSSAVGRTQKVGPSSYRTPGESATCDVTDVTGCDA